MVLKLAKKHIMGEKNYEFPLTCLSPDVENWLLAESLRMEESLFPEFFKTPDGEEALRASFQKYSESKKFCDLHAEEALQQQIWVDFFGPTANKSWWAAKKREWNKCYKQGSFVKGCKF